MKKIIKTLSLFLLLTLSLSACRNVDVYPKNEERTYHSEEKLYDWDVRQEKGYARFLADLTGKDEAHVKERLTKYNENSKLTSFNILELEVREKRDEQVRLITEIISLTALAYIVLRLVYYFYLRKVTGKNPPYFLSKTCLSLALAFILISATSFAYINHQYKTTIKKNIDYFTFGVVDYNDKDIRDIKEIIKTRQSNLYHLTHDGSRLKANSPEISDLVDYVTKE